MMMTLVTMLFQLQVEDPLCPDAFVIVYAVVDRESYDSACDFLYDLTTIDIAKDFPVILVANKTDIVRHRCITEEGQSEMTYIVSGGALNSTHSPQSGVHTAIHTGFGRKHTNATVGGALEGSGT